MPPILEAEGRGIFPIESVLAVLEVKSKLKSDQLDLIGKAACKIAPQFKGTSQENPDGLHIYREASTQDKVATWPIYAVFAYESDALEKDEFDRINEKCGRGKDFITGVCILNKGNWAKLNGKIEKNLSKDIYINARDFLVLMLNQLESMAEKRGKFRLQEWIKISSKFQ